MKELATGLWNLVLVAREMMKHPLTAAPVISCLIAIVVAIGKAIIKKSKV